MFIRRTKTRTVGAQDHYFTFRLVKSVRIGDKVRQRTLLNLGRTSICCPRSGRYCANVWMIYSVVRQRSWTIQRGREPRTTHRGAIDQSAGRNQPGR